MNLAQSIREVRELHEAILSASTGDPMLPFRFHADNTGRSGEWTIAVSQLTSHMDAAVERCQGDIMIGCIVYSLGLDFWDLHIDDVPQDWKTTSWTYDMWLRHEDEEHYNETRSYYSESDFDRTHYSDINRAVNKTSVGDWAHNQDVINTWYRSVVLQGEDILKATTIARLSVR